MTLLDRALRIGGAGAAERTGVVALIYFSMATFAAFDRWPMRSSPPFITCFHPKGRSHSFEPGGPYLTEHAAAPRTS